MLLGDWGVVRSRGAFGADEISECLEVVSGQELDDRYLHAEIAVQSIAEIDHHQGIDAHLLERAATVDFSDVLAEQRSNVSDQHLFDPVVGHTLRGRRGL